MTHLLFRFRHASHGRSRRPREEAALLILNSFCFGVLEGSAGSPVAAVLAGGAMTGTPLAMAELAILADIAARLAPSTASPHRPSRQAVGRLLENNIRGDVFAERTLNSSYAWFELPHQSLLFMRRVEALALFPPNGSIGSR